MESIDGQKLAILALYAILITGFITGRKLTGKRKNSHIRKFAMAAFIPIILTFLSPPFVYDRPLTENLKNVNNDKVVSFEDATKRINEQTEQIRMLMKEVESLRKDLSEANDYYSRLSNILVTVGLVVCIVPLFGRKEDNGDTVEQNPLGLRSYKDE